jgi:hypothetical protein
MLYYSVPPEALDSWPATQPWATGAAVAAMRANKPAKRKAKAKLPKIS